MLTKATYSMIEGAPVNVLDFGAVGDGVANDTAAFVAAMATHKTVFAPAGTYLLNLVLSTSDHVLMGEGIEETIFKPADPTEPVIKLDGDIAGDIINFFSFSNFSIEGVTRQGDGFAIANTADTHGCDHVFMQNVRITKCAKGFACRGRSIWNSFINVFCDDNYDGIFIETDEACNAWSFVNCATRRNRRHGLYANKTDLSISGFIGFTFIDFVTEYNGQDTSIATIYGLYCAGAEGWSFDNVLIENNGEDLVSVTSYGMLFAGAMGRGVIIDGAWAVNSKYLIAFSGNKKSGYVNNVYRLQPYAGGTGLDIAATWADNEPKIELGPVINGSVVVTLDVNGNSPITQGVDYYGSAQTTLDLKNRKAVTINTSASNSAITSITGLINGDTVFLYNFGGGGGTNIITLASGLMASGSLYTINANTGQSFRVLGFPNDGKLTPI